MFRFLGAVLLISVCIIEPAWVQADPQLGIPVTEHQPDGQKLELRVWGDEFFQTTETIDGFTVTIEPSNGWICYAKLSVNGDQLVSTGGRVGSVDPHALGLVPHLRISDEARQKIIKEARGHHEASFSERNLALGRSWVAPSVGNVVGITILVDFSDEVATIPFSEVDDYCNQVGYMGYGNNGSVFDYFHDVSDGLLNYTNYVTPYYYRAANPKSWYEDPSISFPNRARTLVLEALNDLEARGFDFSQYDSNGDDLIDAINIFYAGYRGSTWRSGLWPHCSGVIFSADGVSAQRYQITDLREELMLRTFCHENGHLLCGFPDLYDYGGESSGVGYFCLMAYGAGSNNPAEPCAPLKRYAIWTTDHSLSYSESGLLAVAGENDVFVYPDSAASLTEYYVIENRHNSARDSYLPDAGLAIWHVDEYGSNNNEQMMPNSHYEVTLVQADGLWDLEHGVNYGDANDLWKAPTYVNCTPFTIPGTTWWNGDPTELAVVNVGAAGPTMAFDFILFADCNGNAVIDTLDIINGTSLDANTNNVPDECETVGIDGIQFYDPQTGVPMSPYANEEVFVVGVVYAVMGTLTEGGFYLQDESGGINYFAPNAVGIALGDTIRTIATVFYHEGEIYLHDSSPAPDFWVIGSGPEPDPMEISVYDLISDYENGGTFVRVEGIISELDTNGFWLSQFGEIVKIHISEVSGIDVSGFQNGNVVTVQGACVIRNGEIQIWPRYQNDLENRGPPITRYVATTGSDETGDGTEGNPLATIQHAIGLSLDYDEVCVQPGTYTGLGNRDINFLGKAITVRSLDNDPTTCIVDCQGSESDPHRGFIFTSLEDSTSVLNGFTIRGGYASDWGGGILFFSSSRDTTPAPMIENCIITGNEAPQGAGFAVVNLCYPAFRDCEIVDNSGIGGLWTCTDIFFCVTGTSSVERCRFERNAAGAVFQGGDIWGTPLFKHCVFSSNEGVGFSQGTTWGPAFLDSCEVSGNGGFGIVSSAGGEKSRSVQKKTRRNDFPYPLECWAFNCLIEGNGAGGYKGDSEYDRVFNCIVRNNNGPGITTRFCKFPLVENCSVYENAGSGVIAGWVHSNIVNCNIYSNGLSGIEFSPDFYYANIHSNVISNNGGDGIAITESAYSDIVVTSNTISNNSGNGIQFSFHSTTGGSYFSNNLITFNGLDGFKFVSGDIPEFHCCDLYGNQGDDWEGVIADQLGLDGNISLDPIFCDLNSGIFTLRCDSPCLPGNHPDGPDYGPIGALGLGCFAMEPFIISIDDVGNDQGRQVRLIWNRSEYDAFGSPYPILEYGIYRRQDGFAGSGIAKANFDRLDGWDFLDTVPARGDDVYQTIAPTLCDSTISHGMCWSAFMVSAMTAEPLVFFDSLPDSGYSLDNIAPGTPSSIYAAYEAEGVSLAWDDQPEDDFQSYRIYRGTDPDFMPSPDNLIHETAGSSWIDTTPNPWGYHYKITALDFAGNEGEAGVPESVSDVSASELPTKTALLGALPNPFNPATKLSFHLADEGFVRLVVYDVAGRLVATLVDEHHEVGKYQVTWDGRDAAGRMSAAGVYLYRLNIGSFSETKRMVLVK